MLRVIIGMMVGLLVGSSIPLILMNSKIVAAVLMVAIDAVMGSVRETLESRFSDIELISCFILNLIVTISLVCLGDYLSVNLYYMALCALSISIFRNLAKIRQHMIKKL